MESKESPQTAGKSERKPDVSVVVVIYNMPREAPRTLFSLSVDYQRQISADDYEVIVVDNGSDPPFDPEVLENLAGNFRLIRMEDAPPSPGMAINRGLAEARGEVIGVMVDGARIATPGLLHFARHGTRLYERALVATLNWHLGYDFQGWAIQSGYDQVREDALLMSIDWQKNGYRLFEIGTPDESSVDGWFQPLAESNALFLRRELWESLGGVDEQFDAPGGGLINLDTFCRALELPEAELVILLAEATFHQVHGGTSSNAPPDRQIANWLRWSSQYARIRGRPYELLRARRPPTYLGTLPRPALARMVRAAIHPSPMHPERPLGDNFNRQLWTDATPAKPADQTIADLVALAENEFRYERFTAACAVARLIRERAPDEPEPQRLLSLVAPWLRPDGPIPIRRADYHLALAQAHRILGEQELAATHYRSALAFQPPFSGPPIQYYRGGSMYLALAYELMRELKPTIFVQLGVGKAESYFAFCQSVAEHRTQTTCYGINNLDGDFRATEPGPTTLRDLASYNRRYSSFSTLNTKTFVEAAADFEDNSVDLLHFNASQNYGDAKRDFETWLPKLSRESVVLFRDVVPRRYGSGIWKLWEEIARPRASFVFNFGDSLGVWRKRIFSENDPALLRRLFGADELESKRINDHQAILASALALWRAGEPGDGGKIGDPLQISLFTDQKAGAGQGPAMTKAVAGEGLQTIRFEHIENLGLEPRRHLRIDARARPAFITLFGIKIVQERNDTVVFNAESAAAFEQIKVSPGILKHQEDGALLLVTIGADSHITLPEFHLPADESCYLEIILDPTRARIDRKTADMDDPAVDSKDNVRLDVFHPVEEGYRGTECQSRYFASSSWQCLAINLPARQKMSDGPFRIDPVNSPAIIEIAEVSLKRPETDEIAWTARTPTAFDEFEVAGTASRLPHNKHLRIVSFGGDPQLLLPWATVELNNEPLRLEIWLLVDTNADTVRECLTMPSAQLPQRPLEVVIPYLALSAGEMNGAGEGISLRVPVRIDEKQVVRFENIESLRPSAGHRLRINPLYSPVFLRISRITITRDSDGLVLYGAETAEEFGKIEVSDGAVKQIFAESFMVSAKDTEQNICLPVLDIPADENCRLEIEIEPYSAPSILPRPSAALRPENEEIAARPNLGHRLLDAPDSD